MNLNSAVESQRTQTGINRNELTAKNAESAKTEDLVCSLRMSPSLSSLRSLRQNPSALLRMNAKCFGMWIVGTSLGTTRSSGAPLSPSDAVEGSRRGNEAEEPVNANGLPLYLGSYVGKHTPTASIWLSGKSAVPPCGTRATSRNAFVTSSAPQLRLIRYPVNCDFDAAPRGESNDGSFGLT
jgi:hypothetical protein